MHDEDRPSPRRAGFPNPYFSNFPAELLHQIFSYLVWTSPEQEDLLAASYVCQHWRAVALGNPLLWTQISLSYPRKALVFIERSQETCVEVKVPRSDPNVNATLGFLHRHRSRLRTIRTDTDNFSATSAYLDFANKVPLPELQVLFINGPEDAIQDDSFSFSYGLPSDIPAVVPHHSTPRLHHLSLHRVRMIWDAAIYRDLTFLDVNIPGQTVPLGCLLGILDSCRTLRTLKLRFSSLDTTTVLDGEATVELPKLGLLQLEALSSVHIARLLGHLLLPATTNCILATYAAPNGDYSFLPPDNTRLPCLSSFSHISFDTPSDEMITIKGRSFCNDEVPAPALTLTVHVPDVISALILLPAVLDTSAAKSLSVSLNPLIFVSLTEWHALLAGFPCIQSFLLSGMSNSALRGAFNALREPPHPDFIARLCFRGGLPVLRQIPCTNLAAVKVAQGERPCRVSTDLLWMCQERKRLGFPVETIKADQASLSERCVSELRGIGVNAVLGQV